MADYHSPTVFQETIPTVDMTKLEFLLLSNIFEFEEERDRIYFFSEEGPSDMIWINRPELEKALAESRKHQSEMNNFVEEKLKDTEPDIDEIELDMSGTSWEFILQDIIRRSSTLQYVSILSAFTCSRMRSDGFGGMAVFVTADDIKGFSTSDFLSDCLVELEAKGRDE